MPSKTPQKKPTTSQTPPWQMMLEEMRSQNRATIEAVEASRFALEQRIDRLERESRDRDTVLELAIRELRLDVRQLQGDVRQNSADVRKNSADIQQLQNDVRSLAARVEALARIEERVAALEKRIA